MNAHSNRRWIWIVWFLAGLHGPAWGAALAPAAQVQATVDAVLETLREPDLAAAARRSRIRSLIAESFDFHAMAQGILATHWRQASAAERERFVKLFGRLLEASYIGRIEAYTSERVEYVGERVDGNRAVVETRIVTSNVAIPVRYKLVQEATAWRVYDVVIEEVSLVRNYRSSYGEIARREGIAGLLTQMEEKLKSLEEEVAAAPRS